jgi:hypothetical protein
MFPWPSKRSLAFPGKQPGDNKFMGLSENFLIEKIKPWKYKKMLDEAGLNISIGQF